MARPSRDAGVDLRLPIALRAYTERTSRTRRRGKAPPPWPTAILVLDFETTIDETQRLLFGSYRYYRVHKSERLALECAEEGLVYAEDLCPDQLRVLREYAASRPADVASGFEGRLILRSVPEFLERVLWRGAAKDPPRHHQNPPAAVVGFNLPFDLSRLAVSVSRARGGRTASAQRASAMAGGFSFELFKYEDDQERIRPNQFRPRLAIKTIDSKRHLIGFVPPAKIDDPSLFDRNFRGHFLDLRTLAFALTDRSFSLKSACDEWGVEHPKQAAQEHGVVTPEYIEYNRNDVRATAELYVELIEEFARHPIDLQPSKAFSPASIGKAYLKKMGVQAPAIRQPDFPRDVLGHAMAAYYGGRAECRIRRTPVPVTYVDFLSMYPTVNANLDLWQLVCARSIGVEDATDDVRGLLDSISLEDCFDPARWPSLRALVLVEPRGDVLPVRSRYAHSPNPSWQIGVNPLTSAKPLWYALPDVIAAKLLGDEAPRVLEAVRLVPDDLLEGLTPIDLRKEVAINPGAEDFFRAVVQRRKSLPNESGSRRLSRFLKILANAASYGVYAEMVRRELPPSVEDEISVFGLDGEFIDRTNTPEEPGEYCFPPFAALITSGARLLLAMLERAVSNLGGAYAFCDTDSMAIVSNQDGGVVGCEGGPVRLPSGKPAVRALSWAEVEMIRARFQSLNPYGSAIENVLELEDENFEDPGRTVRRALRCLAISAKRYALYSLDPNGEPLLSVGTDERSGEKWSEHGLGHLLSPIDPESEDRDWIRELWEYEVRRHLGLAASEPNWLDAPALSRVTVSKPHTHDAFRGYNDGRAYAEEVKPFNFMLTAHVRQFGYPPDAEISQFQLVAPWESDRASWSDIRWINRHQPDDRFLARTQTMAGPRIVVIKSFRDVVAEFRSHPEAKSIAPGGGRSGWHTKGLLPRRPVVLDEVHFIGKESNELEDAEGGLIHDEGVRVNSYSDPWEATVAILREMGALEVSARCDIDRTLLWRYLNRNVRPRPDRRNSLAAIARAWQNADSEILQ